MGSSEFGGWSLLPPLLAIGMAIATRRVVVSLFYGTAIGAVMLSFRPLLTAWIQGTPPSDGGVVLDAGYVLAGLVRSVEILCESYLWPMLADDKHLRIMAFVVLMGAMVGILYRNGGMHGIVEWLVPLAKTRLGGQCIAWLMGIVLFFDDYANCLLVGNGMRPITDRLKISREKLAYLVDSTAAPVAGLAIISTWVSTEISNVQSGVDRVFNQAGETGSYGFWLVMWSIPVRFYILYTLILVPLLIFLRRDFGPMLRAERRAIQGDVAGRWRAAGSDLAPPAIPSHRHRWFNALIPILVMLGVLIAMLFETGRRAVLREASLSLNVLNILGNSDSYLALLYSSAAGLLAAIVLSRFQRLMSGSQLFDAGIDGLKAVVPAMVILWLAWTLSEITDNDGLATGAFLADLLTMSQRPEWMSESMFGVYQTLTAPWLMPTWIFLAAAFLSFATGTSWGTMGLLAPITVETMYRLLVSHEIYHQIYDPLMVSAVGSVLAGAIFGDHCSPISDTTIMSSQASWCHHISHVNTQLPYALVAAGVAVACGTIPHGLGVPWWIVLPVGAAVLTAVVLLLGRNAEQDSGSTPTK